MAADSRVSLVSFLNAQPSIAIFLPETVLYNVLIKLSEKRLF